jgi:hypothetical protein
MNNRCNLTTDVEYVRYEGKAVLGGVIYLHDMTQDRFTGTVRRNVVLFNHLCGSNSLNKVIIATSKWSRLGVHREQGEMREGQCKQLHWKSMIDHGTQVRRWLNEDSARSMVDLLLASLTNQENVLEIQVELVDQKKIVPETKAGQELRYTLKQFLQQTKNGSQWAERAEETDEVAKIESEEARKKIKQLDKQIQELKIPFLRQFQRRLFSNVSKSSLQH